MERPSDAPFFMGQTPEERRQQFRLIHTNNEIPDPAVTASKRAYNGRREQGQVLIMSFLDRIGLLDENINEKIFDVRFIRNGFNSYIDEVLPEITDDGDEVQRRFVKNLTLDKVLAYCQLQHKKSIEDIKSIPPDADVETYNTAYLIGSYWRKVDGIIHRALLVPEGKLISIYAREINPSSLKLIEKIDQNT